MTILFHQKNMIDSLPLFIAKYQFIFLSFPLDTL